MLKERERLSRKLNGLVTPGQNLGFSLVELLVIMAIIAILMLGIVGIKRNPLTDVKGAMFNLRSDLALARGEAAKQNKRVTIEFDSDMDDHILDPLINPFSYKICIEDYTSFNAPGLDNDCADVVATVDGVDVLLKEVVFDQRRRVEFFDETPNINAGVRPDVVPLITDDSTVWPQDDTGDTDGLTFPENGAANDENDYIAMLPDGSCETAGVVYLYAADPADGGASLRTPPLALSVSISGITQVRRWAGGTWISK